MNAPRTIGRYTLYGEIASGGMATVHVGRAAGHAGFARTVAIKKLHPQYAADPEFVAMFLDEAWLAAKVHHPNVVQTLDIVSQDGELFLVMDFVDGESLSRIWRAARESGKIPPAPVIASIVSGVLHGLHAAHEAKDEAGKPLNIVHRDVSPQNVMVGVDGVARLLDFGVAKAAVRLQSTHEGQIKGKIAYMAPEQLDLHEASRLSDIYAAGVLLWEGLTGQRLFEAGTEGQLVSKVLRGAIEPPSAVRPGAPPELDAITLRALSKDPKGRYPTAREMALSIERATEIARASQVGEWVEDAAKDVLAKRAERIAELFGPALTGRQSSSTHKAVDSTHVRTLPERASATPPPAPSRPSVPTEATPTTGASRLGPPKKKKRVLVIDDSEVILAKVKRALEDDGHEVTATTRTVGNARHLVDCDLVIIDYHMPGLDGGTVISSLRSATSSGAHGCLFYLYTQDPAVAKGYAALGFDGCFTEKGDFRSLVRQVRSVFRVVQLRALKK